MTTRHFRPSTFLVCYFFFDMSFVIILKMKQTRTNGKVLYGQKSMKHWYTPILHTVVRFFIGNIIHKYEAHGATIVCCCDGAVPFLSSSVLWRIVIPLFWRTRGYAGISPWPCITNLFAFFAEYYLQIFSLFYVPFISNSCCII
jgi:hypothetical protein